MSVPEKAIQMIQFPLFEEDILKEGRFKIQIKGEPNERLQHLEKIMKRFDEDPTFPLVPWMDEVALDLVQQAEKEAIASGRYQYLVLDLQRFDHPVRHVPARLKLKELLKQQCSRQSGWLRIDPLELDELRSLVNERSFTWPLTSDERILIWRYRERLVDCAEALMIFLKSVDWIDEEEVKLVEELLKRWAPLDASQALELMAARQPLEESHQHLLWIHIYRPALLKHKNHFKIYIPQLLQIFLRLVSTQGMADADFYPDVESPDPLNFLVGFLVQLGVEDPVAGTALFWHLRVSSRMARTRGGDNYFAKLQGIFLGSLAQLGPEGVRLSEAFYQQADLFGRLEDLMKAIKKLKGNRDAKQAAIISYLEEPENGLLAFKPVLMPLEPNICISGLLPGRSVLFKSNAFPVKLHFVASQVPNTSQEESDLHAYPVIFKEGDDLRQDQMVLEIIALIDSIWRANGLDLRLTTYRVLATSASTGLVQFVPSLPLSTVLAENDGSLRAYLCPTKPGKPTSDAVRLIDPLVLDNYLRSVAGYSVITYVLGVGDRHLENLLLTPDGHLFHVDYTFVFGRDPKPFPPPMKLCREMIEAMSPVPFEPGGVPIEYQRFKSLCSTAFSILRRHACQIMPAIALLQHTGTADLGPSMDASAGLRGIEGGLQVSRAVAYVQERLMLGIAGGEAEALERFDGLIEDSVTALFPQVMETIHKWAQYWRN